MQKSVPALNGTQETSPDHEKTKELHRFWRGKSARESSKSAQIFRNSHFRTLDDFLVKFHPKSQKSHFSAKFQHFAGNRAFRGQRNSTGKVGNLRKFRDFTKKGTPKPSINSNEYHLFPHPVRKNHYFHQNPTFQRKHAFHMKSPEIQLFRGNPTFRPFPRLRGHPRQPFKNLSETMVF